MLSETMTRMGTGIYLGALLKGMSVGFNINPKLRRSFYCRERSGLKPFNARYQFRDQAGDVELYIWINNGFMKAGFGRLTTPDITATLRDKAALKSFFSPKNPGDPLNMMLDGDLKFSGNLTFLARLGHLMEEFRRAYQNGKKPEQMETSSPVEKGAVALSKSRAERRVERLSSDNSHECAVLKEPYLSRYSIDDFPRLKGLREEFFGGRGEICTERPRLITEYYRLNGFETGPDGKENDPVVRQGGAMEHLLKRKKPIIRDRALLAGTTTTKLPGVIVFPELVGTGIWPELLTMDRRAMNPYRISAADADVLNMEIFPYWTNRNVREWTRTRFKAPRCQELDERWVLYFMWKTAALSHTIPDYPALLSRGLVDVREEAADRLSVETDPKSGSFYRASIMVMDGLLDYSTRLGKKAGMMAPEEQDPARKLELEELSRICAKVPARPAETLHEAIQALWVCKIALHMENMNAGLSIGRLDSVLQPYFLMDAARLKTDAEIEEYTRRAIELTGSLFMQLNDHLPMVPDVGNRLFGGSSSDMATTIGGVDSTGKSAVCDMTYVILKVAEMLTLRDPNLNARYHPEVNSVGYLRRLCEVNVITGATPSIHNDKAVIASLENQGFSVEDARDWGATGCVEPTSCGRHYGHTNCMLLNTVAALEMALNGGRHPLIGEQVGPASPDVSEIKSFDEFLKAYKVQLGYLIDQSVEYNNMLGVGHRNLHPTPLLSSFIQGCMEKGRDAVDGGAKYNSSGAALVSLVDVVDSLTAIKRVVFEEQSMDFKILKEVLDSDFKDNSALQVKLTRKIPKFGSGAPECTALASELVDFIYDRFQSHQNYRGGRYTSGFWSMSNHVAFGTLSGALPSGRRKGKAFTPGITPSAAASPNLIENMRDVASLDPLKMPNNIAFNVKLSPAPGEQHSVFVEHATAYARTYFELGGMQIQFNMVTSDMLKDAMAHPENYRNLMVRISGYNAYFVELNREMQIELIERAEYR
jgi:formate C-acetyltransferase